MNIGDRVKFRTVGGWYNSGIIRDMNEDSYLIEVDELGYKPPKIEFPPQITNLYELKKYNFSADKTYIASGKLEEIKEN